MPNENNQFLSKKLFTQKAVRIMFVILAILILCLCIITGVLLACSPGDAEPFLDEDGSPIAGSISEKLFVDIGGVKQGMFIRGKDIKNPVLLFVHGGPCFSEYFLVEKYPTGLEDHFTVCYWEERGGGLSYSPEITLDSITLEQLSSDTIEVTNYLRERFGQEKIYLMAHSGGTVFAIKTAAKEPERYYAYIGISQIVRTPESEKLAYQYMLEQYSRAGNNKRVEKFKEYPVLESDSNIMPFFKSLLRDQSMHELGVGTMRNMKSVFKDVFIPVFACKAYTLEEKINIWFSKFTFIRKTNIVNQIFASDLRKEVPQLEIPVYFFSGAYDMTVNHDLSKLYLEQLQAPVKGFYTFERSAHSPNYEEPEKMMDIMENDVLAGINSLADKE